MKHTVGSHSDDRGGEADLPCNCELKTYENGLHDGQQVATYKFIRMLENRKKNTAPNSGAGRELKDIIRSLKNE